MVVFGWAYATYFVPKIILWPAFDEDHIGLGPVICKFRSVLCYFFFVCIGVCPLVWYCVICVRDS